jgi:hypothetical protein
MSSARERRPDRDGGAAVRVQGKSMPGAFKHSPRIWRTVSMEWCWATYAWALSESRRQRSSSVESRRQAAAVHPGTSLRNNLG